MAKIGQVFQYIYGGFRVLVGLAGISWMLLGKNNKFEEGIEDIKDAVDGNPKGTTNFSGDPEEDPDYEKK